MKYLLSLLLLAQFSFVHAQSEFESLIKEGVAYHDAGNYAKAIKSYKKALKLEPNSALAHYELSMTYMYAGDLNESIKHADEVLRQNGDFLLEASLTKGSCLDNLGKGIEAVRFFEESIEKYGNHYLLYYNLALTEMKLGHNGKARDALVKGLGENFSHSSSHLLLAMAEENLGHKSRSILSYYFFLILEPTSKRSETAYNVLAKTFHLGEKSDGGGSSININVNASNEEWSAGDLMLGLLGASRFTDEFASMSDLEFFIQNSKTFFGMLGEMKEDKTKDIWWNEYVPFFENLADSDHFEAFCNYILMGHNKDAKKWVSENSDKVEKMASWIGDQD